MSAAAQSPSLLAGIGGFVVGMFTKNLVAKLFALVLAVVIWLTVGRGLSLDHRDETVVMVNLPPGLMLLDDAPEPREVQFRGPTSQINAVRRYDRPEIRLQVPTARLLCQDGCRGQSDRQRDD